MKRKKSANDSNFRHIVLLGTFEVRPTHVYRVVRIKILTYIARRARVEQRDFWLAASYQ